jgi:hypothetical protein
MHNGAPDPKGSMAFLQNQFRCPSILELKDLKAYGDISVDILVNLKDLKACGDILVQLAALDRLHSYMGYFAHKKTPTPLASIGP